MPRARRDVPWLDRRGERYYAFWYDEAAQETKRLSLRTGDAQEAQDRFAAFLVEGAPALAVRNAGLSVSQALDDYYKEHVVEHTAAPERQAHAIVHLQEWFGEKELSTIDMRASRGYADARRRGDVGGGKRRTTRESKMASEATIRRELNVLVAASNHAKKWGRLKILPVVELPKDTRLGEDEEAPYFTKRELWALIEAAEGELRDFMIICYGTGARRRAVQNLQVAQIKWDRNLVILTPKGKKVTKKRQPIVPILRCYRAALERAARRAKDAHRPRVFATADFYRPFARLCQAAGPRFDGRQHPHCLRHSRATHLLQDGKSLYDVAKLLGDTPATIERVYGHHSHERLAGNLED